MVLLSRRDWGKTLSLHGCVAISETSPLHYLTQHIHSLSRNEEFQLRQGYRRFLSIFKNFATVCSQSDKMVRVQRTYETYQRIKKKKKNESRRSLEDPVKKDTKPQLDLLLRNAAYYERSLPLPYELLLKIFHDVVEVSDDPLRDLCHLAQVCETWRMIIVQSPSLWSRIDFRNLPITDGNFRVMYQLIEQTPAILKHVQEVSLRGDLRLKDNGSMALLESFIKAPNVSTLLIEELEPQCRNSIPSQLVRAIGQCTKLRNITIKGSRLLFSNQKWLADHLFDNGQHLEELHLTSSLTSISSQLFRAVASDFCPRLRVLDMSTCDFLNTHSFDAIQLAQNMQNLVILRVANVSFRRVLTIPDYLGLHKLEELSMPIGMRDADRDDVLLATLTYGSERITSLDLRGSGISAHALRDMPSCNVRELHIDDLCPITRQTYCKFIEKWQHSLEILSLVKINCPETIKHCLNALIDSERKTVIRELDLESSDVEPEVLRRFLFAAGTLQSINLSSCRSLPRGCKGRYSVNRVDNAQLLKDLKQRLGEMYPDSETEIEEDNAPRKRRRTKTKRYE